VGKFFAKTADFSSLSLHPDDLLVTHYQVYGHLPNFGAAVLQRQVVQVSVHRQVRLSLKRLKHVVFIVVAEIHFLFVKRKMHDMPCKNNNGTRTSLYLYTSDEYDALYTFGTKDIHMCY
jgi:hypothetical protein